MRQKNSRKPSAKIGQAPVRLGAAQATGNIAAKGSRYPKEGDPSMAIPLYVINMYHSLWSILTSKYIS